MGCMCKHEETEIDETMDSIEENPNHRIQLNYSDGILDSGDRFSTRKIVTTNCRTEEVEPGKFLRKCKTTEKILRDCIGKPAEVVESNTEYTEDYVTQDEMMKGSSIQGPAEIKPFEFPGLQSDLKAIERSVLGSVSSFLKAAEQMADEFFRATFDDGHVSHGEGDTGSIVAPKPKDFGYGSQDISGLARDV